MKPMRILNGVMVFVAVMGMCTPQAFCATQHDQTANVIDVALGEGGILLGQVVDASGMPQAKVPVSLQAGQQQIGVAQTDANGYFAFSGLRGGVCQIVAAQGHAAYRVWTPGTAPPSAQQGALVVAGQDLVRGQLGRLRFWLSNPWVLAGVVGTAIAVPVALVASNRHDHPVTPSGVY